MKAKLLTIICLCGLSSGPVWHDAAKVELPTVGVITVAQFHDMINEAMLNIYLQGDL